MIRGENKAKKRLRLSCDCFVEFGLGHCFQRGWYRGVGAGEARQSGHLFIGSSENREM